jgi:4-hydroxy-tetrahydrodipicolinate reductase
VPGRDVVRVGVVGAGGRMGATVCAAVHGDPRTELVAAVDPNRAGEPAAAGGLVVAGGLDALTEAGAEVAVDFTIAPAARETLPWLADHGIHAVVGTTGFDDGDLARFREAFTASNCLIAANFAIGAVLMMRFAELAAPFFETAEVIELHHDAKRDAPSGTAMATVARMAEASSDWAPDPTEDERAVGARGGKGPADIRVHSVRLRGLVAHQEVLLGTTGQSLTIRHDSYDRSSFMPGVLLAVAAVGSLPERLTLGIDGLLGV